MMQKEADRTLVMPRRQALVALGGAGASLFLSSAGTLPVSAQSFACVLAPEMTEGPYWVDERLNRSDIRTDPSDGSVSQGVLLTLAITVYRVSGASCGVLPGANVDLWHCDAGGLYSDEAANNTVGRKFLRGYQITDDSGVARFTTIYPGWYRGRTIHIHVRIRTFNGTQVLGQFTSQLFFDETINDTIMSQAPYNTRGARDTRNANDNIYTGASNGSRMLLSLTRTAQGYHGAIAFGVNVTPAPLARPAISAGGVVNGGSFAAGIAPLGWVSIFGQNLALATRAVTSSDLVDGSLPASLGGVAVQINNKPAFLHYVSPTQINVQAPAETATGPVQVTVTNAGGASDAVSANLQALAPSFFVAQNYVAAVRSDGVLVTAAQPARPGDVLQLYGTGFGPTQPAVAAGLVFQGSYPLPAMPAISIGGVPAQVSYAGMVAAGLYQFNVTVPSLASGDHAVVAELSGSRTQSGVLLRVQT
jgi:uncharacterized protein (TIGR03437 family)